MTKIATYRYLNSLGGQFSSDLDRCPRYLDLSRFVIDGSYSTTQLVKQSSIVKYIPDNVITVTATFTKSTGIASLKRWEINCSSQYPVASQLNIDLGLGDSERFPLNKATTTIIMLSGSDSSRGFISGDETYQYWYQYFMIGGASYPSISVVNDGTYFYKLDLQTPQVVTLAPIEFNITLDRAVPSGWDNITPGSTLSVTYEATVTITSDNPTNLRITQFGPDSTTLSNDTIQMITNNQAKLSGTVSYVVPEGGNYPIGMPLYIKCYANGYSSTTKSITLYIKK